MADIDFFLELEPGAGFWPYLIHHTRTASNVYSGSSGGVCWERHGNPADG